MEKSSSFKCLCPRPPIDSVAVDIAIHLNRLRIFACCAHLFVAVELVAKAVVHRRPSNLRIRLFCGHVHRMTGSCFGDELRAIFYFAFARIVIHTVAAVLARCALNCVRLLRLAVK
jgi:hypothetical protein